MSKVIALIPAHNEEDRIEQAITSVHQQTHKVDQIIVVSDNSTDNTVNIAHTCGADVFETTSNVHKKSGALNQALYALQDEDDTFILVMDADSAISSVFVEEAYATWGDNVGAVGGIFLGDGDNGLLGDCQRLEYIRYAREIARNKAKARVLTGTATFLRLGLLRRIEHERRKGTFSGEGFYNIHALTEDFELTVCIKRLGYETLSPKRCTVITETMPTVSQLWKQRVRWQRGAIQTLTLHGVNKTTLPYILRQAQTGMGILAIALIWWLALWSVWNGDFSTNWFWVSIGGVFYLERIVTAWRASWRLRALAFLFVVDFVFDGFISTVYLVSMVQTLRGDSLTWGIDTIDTKGV